MHERSYLLQKKYQALQRTRNISIFHVSVCFCVWSMAIKIHSNLNVKTEGNKQILDITLWCCGNKATFVN